MPRIAFFPATGTQSDKATRVSQLPVLKIDETRFDKALGIERQYMRLNIDAWDLQRIIATANQLGREGVVVAGFGFDYESNAIVLGPKRG